MFEETIEKICEETIEARKAGLEKTNRYLQLVELLGKVENNGDLLAKLKATPTPKILKIIT